MALRINIPPDDRKPLTELLGMGKEQRSKVIAALRDAKPEYSMSALADSVAKRAKVDPELLRDAFVMFSGMLSFCTARGLELSEFVEGIVKTAKESYKEWESLSAGELSVFRNQLVELLSQEGSLGITSKANEIKREHEKYFCEARILTDLRPVFKRDLKGGPAAFLVAHTLRITYHDNDELKEMFFGVDSDDLEELERLIARAKSKEQALVESVRATGRQCLKPTE